MYLTVPSIAAIVLRLLFETGRTADVERTHRQLRSRFADRLCGDNADSLADLDRVAGREVAAVAFDADTAARFASQRRANADLLQAGKLNLLRPRSSSISSLASTMTVAVDRIDDVVKRCAADDAVAKRFDLFTVSDDRLGPNAAERAAILFAKRSRPERRRPDGASGNPSRPF